MQAIASANDTIPDWADRVWIVFKRWLSRKPAGYRFQIENFRLYVDIHKPLPKPNTDRAYGFLPVKAENERLIKKLAPKATTAVSAHGCYSMEWKKI
jgi:hypothetical protein